ncbi:alcohol dehydrogenase catalytic domain-containing protein, partial [Klebsiella pneumoniae]
MATRIEFSKHGGPEVLQAVEFTPRDPAEHEIQVENKAIGINYIDTYVRSGLYPPPSLPSGLGTEAAGIVSKVGHGVTHIKVGDLLWSSFFGHADQMVGLCTGGQLGGR